MLRRVEPARPAASPGYSDAEKQAMQRAVVRLFERWNLGDREAAVLLGDISERTVQRWRQGLLGRVGVDLAARLSNLLGVHKALRLLFRAPERGYGWVRRPNADFGGRSALDVMLDGQLTDIMRVRRYLDAARGPW